jgi:LPS sulfotransferase NodH
MEASSSLGHGRTLAIFARHLRGRAVADLMNVVQMIKQQLGRSAVTRSLIDTVGTIRHPFALSEQIVMLHTGRCGSTVLARMLDEHPSIYWAGELFARMTERHPEVPPGPGALKTITRKGRRAGRHTGKRFYGFELKYLPQQHLRREFLNLRLEDCVSLLRRLRFLRFIVLHRENYLRQAISVQVGREQRRWHARTAPEKPKLIVLNLESFRPGPPRIGLLDEFRSLEENHDKLKHLLAHDQVLYLSYERDILEDPTQAYLKCCRFLGVAPASPQIALARTNPFAYDEIVLNMPAVTTLLRNTKYAWMLDA